MAPIEFEHLPTLDDSYDQIQKIAIGGMAEVYRGRQKNLDRPVAIKRIREELRSNKDIQERFRREARSAANLLHQNLAHVYDYRKAGEGKGSDAYIIMEYIDGFDLAELLERTDSIPIDVAVMIAINVLAGLSHVHAQGMVHRDLKPDNIRISSRGEVKIMDFGIALDPSEANLTMPGVMIGSPHYLSPEQVVGAKLDSRADIFSFGITFYEMLTHKKPFFETQKESVYTRIQKGEYIKPEHIRPEIPNLLSRLIENCLAVNPSRRPQSALKLSSILMDFLIQNYSISFEARIRQFLMQSKILSGKPELIEVVEPTQGGLGFSLFSKIGFRVDTVIDRLLARKKLMAFLVVTLAALAFGLRWWLKHKGVVAHPAKP